MTVRTSLSRHQPQHEALRGRYGPWAVVTGASDGIGCAFAECLAEAGVGVVLVARREAVLRALAEQLSRAHGVDTLVVPVDLASPAGVDTLIMRTTSLDVGLLVAAAGFGTSGPFVESDLRHELEMVDVNCRAVAALGHHFGRRLAQRGRGGLILLSSIVAFQGVPRAANYAATKAYVQSLAEGLRVELAPRGVDVLASAPGPVRSGFAARARMTLGAAASPDHVARATLAALPGWMGTTRPGLQSKLLGWSLGLLPRGLRVRVMTGIMAGMTRAGG